MPESKQYPQIERIQGGVVVPYNVSRVTREEEDGTQAAFYVFDKIKLDRQDLPSLESIKRHIVQQLRQDLHAHVFVHYDLGSQNSINGLAQKAQRKGRSSIQDECQAILDWVDDCLGYYYAKKDEILAATDEANLTGVAWDFEANHSKPVTLKSLREIREMF